jgi:hypothetical protein
MISCRRLLLLAAFCRRWYDSARTCCHAHLQSLGRRGGDDDDDDDMGKRSQ